MRSPTLPPIRMNAAETSASSAIADWTPLTVVSRSSTTAEIETFISDVSTTSTNIAIDSRIGEPLIARRLLGTADIGYVGHRERTPSQAKKRNRSTGPPAATGSTTSGSRAIPCSAITVTLTAVSSVPRHRQQTAAGRLVTLVGPCGPFIIHNG